MLVAAAVCPHPPLLIPAAMGAAGSAVGRSGHGSGGGPGGASELRELRASCLAAVAGLLAAGPDLLIVVGGGPASAAWTGQVTGSLRPFGIPWPAAGPVLPLPLSLTVGAWLLDQASRAALDGCPAEDGHAARDGHPAKDGHAARDRAVPGSVVPGGLAPRGLELRAVAADMLPADCLRLGADLAGHGTRVALLAMGDASARKAAGVPGAADPAAERYDAGVAAALANADPAALASLDPALDGELMIAGRAAWQVLAGAAGGTALRGRLRCAVAPFDVTYLVASWETLAARPHPPRCQ